MVQAEKRLRDLKARDLMSEVLVMLETEMSAREAAQLFKANRITGAPVVDDQGQIVGVLSVTDLMAYGMGADVQAKKEAGLYHPADLVSLDQAVGEERLSALEGMKVKDIMFPRFVSATSSTAISTIATHMLQKKVRRILIIDNGRLVGIVTQTDILKAVAHEI